MDMLLSLPVASYFFSSSPPSWSTSLNLLFFYMTWSTLVLSQPPLRIELIGVTAIRIIFWLLPSLVFLLCDTLAPSLAENIKYSGAAALPPREIKALARTVSLALLNFALETIVEGAVSLGLTIWLRVPVFRTSTTLPLPWQMVKHIALLLVAREFLTYYLHRFVLHSSSSGNSSGRISAWHNRYGHPRRAPSNSLGLMVDHPVPFLIHRFLPTYLPALALALRRNSGLHLLTYFVFVGLVTIEETLAMSAYTVVPGILMGGITRRTALHYCRPAGGNFGCWGLADWLHGTSQGGDVVSDMKDEGEKHSVKERGEKTAGSAGSAVRDGLSELRKSARSRGRKSKKDA